MKEIVSRPKNRNRWTAKDARVPRVTAMTVAPIAASIESARASRRPVLSSAAPNHWVVQFVIGQDWPRSPLKAYRRMTRKRDVQEQDHPEHGGLQGDPAASSGHHSASNAPSRPAAHR